MHTRLSAGQATQYRHILDAAEGKEPYFPPEGYVLCDDCRSIYPKPPYYTFDPDECEIATGMGGVLHAAYEACSGTLCPSCAGDLAPDDPKDKRRPKRYPWLVWGAEGASTEEEDDAI